MNKASRRHIKRNQLTNQTEIDLNESKKEEEERQKILWMLIFRFWSHKWPDRMVESKKRALKNANFMTENTLDAFDYDVIAHKTQA